MPDAPLFVQEGWKANRVYNIAGHLILTDGDSKEQLGSALQSLQLDIESLDGLDDGDRHELSLELQRAREEIAQAVVPKEQVLGRMARIKGRLQGLGGVVAAAGSVATSIAGIVQIASGIL